MNLDNARRRVFDAGGEGYQELANKVVRDIVVLAAPAYGLSHIGDEDGARLLLMMALDKDKDFKTRSEGFFGVYHTADERAAGPLAAMLMDPHDHEWLRGYAAMVLGSIGGPQALEPLTHALRERSTVIRWFAIRGVGHVKHPSATDLLVAALDWPESKTTSTPDRADLRSGIVMALGEMGDERAIEPLTALLNDADPEVQADAAAALKRISGEAPAT
jgi:HEAT repeat protein